MKRDIQKPFGWYRRLLPHRDDEMSLLQSITYRLADSLPQHLLVQLKTELETIPAEKQEVESRKRIEEWLDAGYGACQLQHPEAAEIVVNGWKHFNGERYDLIAWVVMPNHVHVLIRLYEGQLLGKVVQSWKSYTGRKISALKLYRAGARCSQGGKSFWMREYWDRYIRDEEHLANTIDYIHNNPVKAGLVKHPEEWKWSSAAAER